MTKIMSYRIIAIYDDSMAFAKNTEFPKEEIQFAKWCKALSHPARVSIIKTLLTRKECICGDLVLDLPLSQSTVSQHLKALKESGLIQGEVEGAKSKYCINKKNMKIFMKIMGTFQESIQEGCC
jgi:ArsR family transcriptional regulator